MADINLKQVIHNVKEAYLTVSGDTPSSVKYGNIDTKVGELVKPTGDLEITENGEYDVTAYETATVNVASGGGGGTINDDVKITFVPFSDIFETIKSNMEVNYNA